MDETSSGSCPLAGIFVGGVELRGCRICILRLPFPFPPSFNAVKPGNLLIELRARSAFGETGNLGDIEEQGSQGVGRIGVEGLKAPPEPCVAVTVRPAGTKHKHLARDI